MNLVHNQIQKYNIIYYIILYYIILYYIILYYIILYYIILYYIILYYIILYYIYFIVSMPHYIGNTICLSNSSTGGIFRLHELLLFRMCGWLFL